MELMCQFNLSKRQIEAKYNIDFERYFAWEQEHLQALEKDGLVQVDAEQIQVTPVGRLLIRNIATVFDAYSRKNNVRMLSRSI
jgi:oxygen-independent coproporphyrinogen-3 oxidase